MDILASVVYSVSVTPDGRKAISGSNDTTLRVWDLESGGCLRTLEGHKSGVRSVSITTDGKRTVSGSNDRTLRVWDLESGKCLKTLMGHTDDVTSVSITADGKRAVSGSDDKTLRVWDLESGECLRTLEGHTDDVTSVSITADGKGAVSGSWDEIVRVWDLESGECLRTLEGHEGGVRSVSITRDGKRAVSGSGDKTLRVWDIDSGKCLRVLEGHTSSVENVSITPDGKWAVSASWDGTLRVWDIESGECLRTLMWHMDRVNSVSITPDGKRAVSASWDGTLRVWDIDSGRCLSSVAVGTVEALLPGPAYIKQVVDKREAHKEEDRSAVPDGIVDRLHFTVTSPPMVQLGTSFVVDIWAHLERQRKAVIQRAQEAAPKGEIAIKSKGPVQVARGTVLTVRLELEGLIVEDPEDTILWDGDIGNATFPVRVPDDAAEGSSPGLATFHVDGLQIARVYFVIQVGRTSLSVDHIPTQEERHCKAFACYASADREEVFPRLHGIQKATPQLEIFLDVLSLRSGQNWEQELRKVIPSSDVFYLFWSDNASRSEWVEKEWRCALKTRGLDFIDPFPLVSPEEVPPPPELASKHFNDLWLALMRK